jgi:hypothetical protein
LETDRTVKNDRAFRKLTLQNGAQIKDGKKQKKPAQRIDPEGKRNRPGNARGNGIGKRIARYPEYGEKKEG